MHVVHRRAIASLIACVAALAACDRARAQLPPPPPAGGAGYTVAYTSTNAGWTSTGVMGFAYGPYSLMGSSYGAWAFTGGSAWTMMPGTADCQGTITATFTWNNGGNTSNTPPPGVVVKETCSATWSGNSGACSNGLGHPVVTGTNSASCGGSRYQFIAAPGPSFSVTCSPSASASAWSPPLIGGSATVSYSAAAMPVDIALSGGIPGTGTRSYLVGQMCTAALVTPAETPPLVTPGFTPGWSIAGGEPFFGWTANRASASLVPPVPLSGLASVSVYYRAAAGIIWVTATGHLTVPAGALPVGTVAFTVARRMGTVAPSSDLRVCRRPGAEPGNQAPGWPDNGVALWPLTGTPTKLDFGGILDSVYGYPPIGIRFRSSVTTPPEYGSGYGWNYVQIASPNRMRTYMQNGSLKTETVSTTGLDLHYPYRPTPFMDEGGATAPGVFQCSGQVETGGDEPYMELAGLQSASVNESYSMWVMYCPPSPDPGHPSAYVPLGRCDWAWSGSAAQTGGVWSLSSSSSSNTEFVPSGHPTWSNIVQPPLPWHQVP